MAGRWDRLGAAADESARLVRNLIFATLLAAFCNAILRQRRLPTAAPRRGEGAVVAQPHAAAAREREAELAPSPSREELDELQASADTAAAHVRNVYLAFLLFGAYFAIIIDSTTHEQLLHGNPVTVKLPLLDVGIPLFAFCWITPALFVLVPFNLLIQLHLLAGKLHRLRLAIDRALPERGRVSGYEHRVWFLSALHLVRCRRSMPGTLLCPSERSKLGLD